MTNPRNRHLPDRDPMMTNWYLIRATEIRERTIAAAEHQDRLEVLGIRTSLVQRIAGHFTAICTRARDQISRTSLSQYRTPNTDLRPC